MQKKQKEIMEKKVLDRIRIDRVAYYEERMEEAERLLDAAERALCGNDEFCSGDTDRLTPRQKGTLYGLIGMLGSYYESTEWKRDFADDEAGCFPQTMKRGVLSEDGIYNLLERFKEYKMNPLS